MKRQSHPTYLPIHVVCVCICVCLYLSDKMLSLGYNQSDIVRAVEENQCNETMATYLLLQQQYRLVWARLCYPSNFGDATNYATTTPDHQLLINWGSGMSVSYTSSVNLNSGLPHDVLWYHQWMSLPRLCANSHELCTHQYSNCLGEHLWISLSVSV